MNRYYDNWERLVDAVMRREKLLNLCRQSSRSTSIRSNSSSSAAFDSSSHNSDPLDDFFSSRSSGSSPFRLSAKEKHTPAIGVRSLWRGLSRLRISKLMMIKKEPKLTISPNQMRNVHVNDQELKEAEIQRLRDLHTLKAHIETIVRLKGIGGNTIRMSYSI